MVDIFNKEFDTVRLKKTRICVIMLLGGIMPKRKVNKYIDIKTFTKTIKNGGNDYETENCNLR